MSPAPITATRCATEGSFVRLLHVLASAVHSTASGWRASRGEVDHGGVQYTSASFLVGPLLAFGVLGVFVLLLRWTYRRGGSVVDDARPRPDARDEYGTLVPVASPGTYVEGEILRRTLEAAGVRANLADARSTDRACSCSPATSDRAREILAALIRVRPAG